MKTVYKIGLLEVISEDNKDIINFNHSSGKTTYELVYQGGQASIQKAFWRQSGFGGSIKGDQDLLWKEFRKKLKANIQ